MRAMVSIDKGGSVVIRMDSSNAILLGCLIEEAGDGDADWESCSRTIKAIAGMARIDEREQRGPA